MAETTATGGKQSPTPDRIDRLTGGLAVFGGLCLLVASVPGRFYAGRPGDSYVFDPPPFSGLWVQRVVIPVLAVLAVLGVFAVVVGLLRRDRGPGRWHDVAGGVTALGSGVLLFAVLLLASTGSLSGGSPDVIGALAVTVGALGGLLAGLVVVVAGVLWGVGYLRRGRRRLGVTLVVVPLVTLLLVVLATFVELPTGTGLLVVLPTITGLVVLGTDLWRGPADDSVRGVDSDPTSESDGSDEPAGDEESVARSEDQGA